MYSCLRLTKIAIALAIAIELLQPSMAVGKERTKSGSNDLSFRVALSNEVGLDRHPESENNKNCKNGICSGVGSPDSSGAGSRFMEG